MVAIPTNDRKSEDGTGQVNIFSQSFCRRNVQVALLIFSIIDIKASVKTLTRRIKIRESWPRTQGRRPGTVSAIFTSGSALRTRNFICPSAPKS